MAKSKATKTNDLGELNMSMAGSISPGVYVMDGGNNDVRESEWAAVEDQNFGFWQARGKPTPVYGSEWAAGIDISADLEVGDAISYYDDRNVFHIKTARGTSDSKARLYIEAGERVLVPTGLHANIPENCYLAVHSRSGTSWKKGLILTNGVGVVDSDYVEEIKVSLTNVSGSRVYLEDGERIAQLLLMPVVKPTLGWEVLKEKPAQKTSRAGGFGSTGK